MNTLIHRFFMSTMLSALTLACHGSTRSSSHSVDDTKTSQPTAELLELSPAARRSYANNAATPSTLLEQDESAYAARVFAWAGETVVVTPSALFRLREGKNVVAHRADFGHLVTLADDSVVFWREGQLRALLLETLKEKELFSLKDKPLYLLSQGPRLAWVAIDHQQIYSIQTMSAGSVHFLFGARDELSGPVLFDEAVYFVMSAQGGWKIGRAPLDGTSVTFTKIYKSRRPSMIARGPDGVYFYDGRKRGVRHLSPDLSVEKTMAQNAICSPLVVSSRVVCAQLGGIFDIPHPGAVPRPVASELGGPVSDIAASETMAYWISDSGENRMAVRSAPLPSL